MTSREGIPIDGSKGEGGGQILRTSLSLSMASGRPFRIENIRSGRPKPGLMRQHLTAVEAAQQVCGAQVDGVEIGSTALGFCPGEIQGSEYHFSVGTAGSATLVAQTVLPALLLAKEPSRLTLEGGTHNPYSPPFDFFEKSYLPLLTRMGVGISATLDRLGFYPAGGGKFSLEIEPPQDGLAQIELMERGALKRLHAEAVVSNLPISIAQRELEVVGRKLSLGEQAMEAREETRSFGPGNFLMVVAEFENVTEVFSGFGQRGVAAELIGERTAKRAKRFLESDAAIGPHLADQLVLPMALAGGGRFTTLRPSRHLLTNVYVIQRFLPIEINVEEGSRGLWTVKLGNS